MSELKRLNWVLKKYCTVWLLPGTPKSTTFYTFFCFVAHSLNISRELWGTLVVLKRIIKYCPMALGL